MKKYKFKLIRISVPNGAVTELENISNEYSKQGWELKSTQYFSDILSFLLVFENNQ